MAKKSKKIPLDNSPRTSGPRPDSDKRKGLFRNRMIPLVIIVVLGIAVYANTVHAPFVLDDFHSIIENPVIKDVRRIFGPENTYKNRILTQLTFAMNYALHGRSVAGYHVFNILLHVLNGLLVYWLIVVTFTSSHPFSSLPLQRMTASHPYRWIPLFAALLFVSHPVQTQAVTYVVQRSASLATLFYLICLVMYIKFRSTESSGKTRYALYAASLISAVLAMLSKEIAFTLPIMVVLYDLLFFQGEIRKRIPCLLPFLLTMLLIPLSLLSYGDLKGTDGMDDLTKLAGSGDVSRWDYVFTQFRVIITYLRLLFFPIDQNLDYDYPVFRTFFASPVIFSSLILTAVLCWGLYLLSRSYKTDPGTGAWYRLIAFGILWFFVTLSVESSLIPIADVIFEHRLYLPSIGFSLAIVSGLAFIQAVLVDHGKMNVRMFVPVMILAVMILSAAAYARNTVWRDELTLWQDVLKKSPGKARAHYGIGRAYQNQRRLNDAITEYLAAINLKMDHAPAHNDLGTAYQFQGRLNDAVREFREAIRIKPDYAEAHSNLGVVYAQQGNFGGALEHLQSAIKFNPDYAKAHANLGLVYRAQGRLDDAIREYQTAIRLKLDNRELCHYSLGEAYHAQGRLDEASREFQAAITLRPAYADAHNDLGEVYQKQGRRDDAVRAFQAAIQYQPNHAGARSNLSNLRNSPQISK